MTPAGGSLAHDADLLARMDPEIAAVVPGLPVMDLSDIPAARRARAVLMAQSLSSFEPDLAVQVEDLSVPGYLPGDPDVAVRLYRPVDHAGSLPALVWIHGGGHVVGQVEQDDPTMQHLVRELGCVAASVDWRRAPEHPFPAALHDAAAALEFVHDQAPRLGVDPHRIAIGGASSGGGVAAGLALLARDRAMVQLVLQLLLYPMLDDRNTTPSSHLVRDERLWNRRSNLRAWQAYLGDAWATDEVSPLAAPARAPDLTGVAPAYVAVGDLDGFLDEDVDYATRLINAGVATELHVYPGAPHGFDLFNPAAGVSRQYLRDRDAALLRAFTPTGHHAG